MSPSDNLIRERPRLESLDWLRGLLALSIMFYHLTSWLFHAPDASTLLGVMGIYGVSCFFVLSGLSMAAAYSGFFARRGSLAEFYVRRIFRIWPMLWLAVFAVVLGNLVLKGEGTEPWLVILNITTLFGFISPGSYINTGAWSIGNEMVYYAITPLLLGLYDRGRLYGNLLLVIAIAAGAYFGTAALSTETILADQWLTYISPLNNLYFYVAGIAIYYNTRNLKLSGPVVAGILAAGSAILLWYPASGDLINAVTGPGRLAFSVAAALLVLAFFKMNPPLPTWVSRPLASLGAATYGIYLLHPVVYSGISFLTGTPDSDMMRIQAMLFTALCSVAISLVVYRLVELPLIRAGKQVARRFGRRYAERLV